MPKLNSLPQPEKISLLKDTPLEPATDAYSCLHNTSLYALKWCLSDSGRQMSRGLLQQAKEQLNSSPNMTVGDFVAQTKH